MSSREVNRLKMYDRDIPDYDLFNSIDDEIIQIASPPIKVYTFNIAKTMGDSGSLLDDLYSETDIIDENKIADGNRYGGGGYEIDVNSIRPGEQFDMPIEVPGYYQESTWTQELMRMGINEPEELAITFNYQTMLSKLGKEIKIGDVIQTFRGKVFRVMDAYVADETVGWKYIHFHVIGKKPDGIDNLVLPDNPNIPKLSGNGI